MDYSKTVIYMADDDADDRYYMRQSLRNIYPAVTIVEAQDGSELMEMLVSWSREPTHQPVHLILLDVNMPKMNGLEVLTALKANPLLCHIPAVMVSTSDEAVLIDTAYQNGASGYLKKPMSYSHLDQITKAVGIYFEGTTAVN